MLLTYTYPTPKLSPHRRRCISTFPQKNSLCMIYKRFNYGDTENVLINHLLLVIPMSYPCHYTNLCPHKPHKHAHTHTHTHTLTHTYEHMHERNQNHYNVELGYLCRFLILVFYWYSKAIPGIPCFYPSVLTRACVQNKTVLPQFI